MNTNLFTDLIALVYPNYCLGCKLGLTKGEQMICTSCIHGLPKTNYHLIKENSLKNKFYGRIQIEYALSYLKFIKSGKVQRLLHHLKYLNKPEIGELLGRWYGSTLIQAGYADKFDLIVPVPLHKSKLKARGYNQSEFFARGVAESMKISFDSPLIRVVKSETQTRKNRLERWNNVENIFIVSNGSSINNKRVLLIDDVITTGSTLEACGQQVLNSGKAKSLSICTIASAE